MTNILYIKAHPIVNYDPSTSTVLWDIHFDAPDYIYAASPIIFSVAQGSLNPAATPLPTFPDYTAAIAYYTAAGSAALIADFNATYGGTIWTSANVQTVELTVNDRFNALPPAGGTRTQSALTLSLVGTGATGTQISATNDATVNVTVSTSATATIAGAAVSTVALKICATNNATEASWMTVQTSETSQSYSLAIALQGVTAGKGCLTSLVPAGWYCKLVNSGSGTHAETFISGQKVIYS